MLLRNTTFIITCSSRTGSTFLVHLLRSHPEIMCYGEIFSVPKPNGFSGRYAELLRTEPEYLEKFCAYRDNDQTGFLYKIAFDPQGRKVCGFKFKYGQLDHPMFEKVSAQLIADTDIKIIHLVRRNLLARYLSQYVANNVTGFTMRLENEQLPDIPPVTLNPEVCKKDFDKAVSQRQKYGELFQSHPVFPLFYEDLLDGTTKEKVTAELLDFLEVPFAPLTSVTQKIAQKPLHEAIANYGALKEFFAGSAHASLFEACHCRLSP